MSVRVARDGQVFSTNVAGVERRVGWVDRRNAQGREARTWRAVAASGSLRAGFRRRADGIEWLLNGGA